MKLQRLLVTFLILFIIGGVAWISINMNTTQNVHRDGKFYGSLYQPVVLEFIAETRRDYWEISYQTEGYMENDYDVAIYMVDRCNYDLIMKGDDPQSFSIMSEDFSAQYKIRPNFQGTCDLNNEIYIVWVVKEGTVIVTFDSQKVYCRSLISFSIFCTVGLGLLSILYIAYYRSKSDIETTQIPKMFVKNRREPTYCTMCGIAISSEANYCPHCGKVYHSPDLDI